MFAELLIALFVTIAVLGFFYALSFFVWRGLRELWQHRAGPVDAVRAFWTGLKPVAYVRKRWPRLWAFLAARLDAARFAGLPLTLLVVGAGYLFFLLAGLIEELFEQEEIVTVDKWIFDRLDPFRSEGAITLYKWITHFGDMETMIAIALVITAMLAVHGPKRFMLPLWVSVLGAQITSWSGKYFFYRPRPDFIVDLSVSSPSFPSGHSTGAMSVYVLLAYILARDIGNARQRFETGFWLTALALLIAFSRVFLGVHYASDVAAGLLVGGFWVLVAITIGEWRRQRDG